MKRLLLFDIDGTLLHGGPLWKECFESALRAAAPDAELRPTTFNGKTDGQICREMLANHFGDDVAALDRCVREVLARYVALARAQAEARRHEVELLPGVRTLLDALADDRRATRALLTGNLEAGARLKLGAVGLWEEFAFGAFADDHWERNRLGAVARARAQERTGVRFEPEEIVIIGDTVHDVACARACGARVIAVGTGRRVDQAELRACGPDHYLENLADTDAVLRAIQS
jgi:phosphoglycolate phosphatase